MKIIDTIVRLDLLATPRDRWVAFTAGSPVSDSVTRLIEGAFDHAPVVDERQHVLGFIDRRQVQASSQLDFPAVRAQVRESCLGPVAGLSEILECLRRHSCAIVAKESRLPAKQIDCVGFLTIADLNRHAFRSGLFVEIAQAEALLALELDDPGKTDVEWMQLLMAVGKGRDQILSLWEQSQQRNRDIGPIAWCTFREMLLLWQSRARKGVLPPAWVRNLKAINEIGLFRNDVAHPARPLFLDVQDIVRTERLLEQVRLIVQLLGHPTGLHPRPKNSRRRVPPVRSASRAS